jgi:hypothetical protein
MISDEELSERFPHIRLDYENKHFAAGCSAASCC